MSNRWREKMELDYLKEFMLLVETRYYAEAAEKLFISPSTLTRHIQTLEKELGKPLFIRTSRKVELTSFGKVFLPYVERIVAVQEEFSTNVLVKLRRDEKVIVGYLGGLGIYRVGSVINSFKRDHPEINLEYIQARPEWQVEMLRDSTLDILVTSTDVLPHDEFDSMFCDEDVYVVVVPADHPLAGKEKIELRELAGEKLSLMKSFAEGTSDFMIKCQEAGFQPEYSIVDANNLIDLAAIAGQVVVMTKKPALFYANQSVSVIDLEPAFKIEMVLAYRKFPPLLVNERLFLDYLSEALHEE